MGAILVRVGNASRQPLADRMDVHLVNASTDATVKVASDVPGDAALKFDGLVERQTYLVKVFPVRHRPVAQFAMAGSDQEPARVQLYAPLHPERVRAATFPDISRFTPTCAAYSSAPPSKAWRARDRRSTLG